MTNKRKGFTLVEVIVVLVILAILAAVIIPSMTGWIDKAKEKRLIVACRTCVTAAQTLASEAYGVNGTSTPPDGGAVIALAGVNGTASNISLDAASAAVNTLTYSDGTESMTYTRLPSPQYTIGTGLAKEMTAAWNWAQNFNLNGREEEYLTIDYAGTDKKPNPLLSPLSDAQMKSIFGDLATKDGTYYIYPMAIYSKDGNPLNIQYVTLQNPTKSSGQNRYVASAFLIDGKTYISTAREDGKLVGRVNAQEGDKQYYFQNLMNNPSLDSTQQFVDMLTESGYYKMAQ